MRNTNFGMRWVNCRKDFEQEKTERTEKVKSFSFLRSLCFLLFKSSLFYGRQPILRHLQRSGPEQEVDDASFVRLQPVEARGRNRADVQPVDVRGVDAPLDELLVVGDRCAHQRRADLLKHLILRALDDRGEG